MSAELTPAMLAGTPVGGPDGMALCNTCNRSLTDGKRDHDREGAEPDTVYAYATGAKTPEGTWALRWVSCAECGPPGIAETVERGERAPTETVAKATLAYDERIDAFVLADPERPTDSVEAAAEDGESQ
jgi:hypothetical protein